MSWLSTRRIAVSLRILLAAITAFLFLSTQAYAAPVYNPATGHYYERVESLGITWNEAKAAAESKSYLGISGHLATITNASEQSFVAQNLLPGQSGRDIYHLGGVQSSTGSEPNGGWGWITGEPWGYTDWSFNNPSDDGNQDVLAIYGNPTNTQAYTHWDDYWATERTFSGGYVVEYPGLISQNLTIPAKPLTTVNSALLYANTLYVIEARGTYTYDSTANPDGIADAEWSYHVNPSSPNYHKWAEEPYSAPAGQGFLDLRINETDVDWLGSTNGATYSAHTYSPNHVYRQYVKGTGSQLSFKISDDPGAVGNAGGLEVEISAVGTTVNSRTPRPLTPPPPVPTDIIPNLAKWDGSNWNPVRVGDLAAGNVHVITHGWGRNERDWVEQNPGQPVWKMRNGFGAGTAKSNFFNDFQSVAETIRIAYLTDGADPNDFHILSFSWIEDSATRGVVPGPFDARDSQNGTEAAAGRLRDALGLAGISASNRIHFLGHSHGAKVSTLAANYLENPSIPSIPVEQLTLWDSPEKGNGLLDPIYSGAYNSLQSELDKLDIGTDPGQTFVDNYPSLATFGFGNIYQDVVNARLVPSSYGSGGSSAHGYPIRWYAGATGNGFGFDWSRFIQNPSLILDDNYLQSNTTEYELIPSFLPSRQFGTQPLTLEELYAEGIVVNQGTGKRLADGVLSLPTPTSTSVAGLTALAAHDGSSPPEASSAYWDSLITVRERDSALSFEFEFLSVGDGDELGIWIDDKLRFVVPGYLAGFGLQTRSIDLSDLGPGYHLLTVALHGTGDVNAEVYVGNLQAMSVIPEPTTLTLVALSTALLLTHGRRRR